MNLYCRERSEGSPGGTEKWAVDFYKQLDHARKPAACLSCAGPCEAACPHGLKVRAKLVRTHKRLEA